MATTERNSRTGLRRCATCQKREQRLEDYPPQCPVCAMPAQYAPELDRWVHLDGTSNQACWAAIMSGRVDILHGFDWPRLKAEVAA